MTRSLLRFNGHRSRIASSAIVWNTVMPGLGVALILGGAILPAIAVAAVAAIAMHVFLARSTRSARPRTVEVGTQSRDTRTLSAHNPRGDKEVHDVDRLP